MFFLRETSFLFSFFFFLFLSLSNSQAQNPKPSNLEDSIFQNFRKGLNHAKEKKNDKAIESFTTVLEKIKELENKNNPVPRYVHDAKIIIYFFIGKLQFTKPNKNENKSMFFLKKAIDLYQTTYRTKSQSPEKTRTAYDKAEELLQQLTKPSNQPTNSRPQPNVKKNPQSSELSNLTTKENKTTTPSSKPQQKESFFCASSAMHTTSCSALGIGILSGVISIITIILAANSVSDIKKRLGRPNADTNKIHEDHELSQRLEVASSITLGLASGSLLIGIVLYFNLAPHPPRFQKPEKMSPKTHILLNSRNILDIR